MAAGNEIANVPANKKVTNGTFTDKGNRLNHSNGTASAVIPTPIINNAKIIGFNDMSIIPCCPTKNVSTQAGVDD